MMKRICRSLLISGLICCAGCSGSTITGKVVDAVTNEPVEVTLSATANTNIAEEQTKAKLYTVSSKDGSFKFKGCLPNKEYVINITDSNYLYNPVSIKTPENRKISDMSKIDVLKKPTRYGVYVWDRQKSDWRELDHNYILKVEKTSIRPNASAGAVMDIYIPMAMDMDKVFISDLCEGENSTETGTYYGQYSQIGQLEKAHQIDASTIVAFYGDYFTDYEIMGLFYYPEIGIYDGSKKYPGKFDFTQGYHAGIRSMRGAGQCCRYLDVKRDYHVKSVRDIAEKKIGGLILCSVDLPKDTYNVFIAGGKLELNQSKDMGHLLTDGIPGVVFMMKQ